jgi:hypothetical protein
MAVAKVGFNCGGKQLFIYIFSKAQSQVIKEIKPILTAASPVNLVP